MKSAKIHYRSKKDRYYKARQWVGKKTLCFYLYHTESSSTNHLHLDSLNWHIFPNPVEPFRAHFYVPFYRWEIRPEHSLSLSFAYICLAYFFLPQTGFLWVSRNKAIILQLQLLPDPQPQGQGPSPTPTEKSEKDPDWSSLGHMTSREGRHQSLVRAHPHPSCLKLGVHNSPEQGRRMLEWTKYWWAMWHQHEFSGSKTFILLTSWNSCLSTHF